MSGKPTGAARCAAALAVGLVASGTIVRGSILGTPHDFSSKGWSGGAVCLPCHTSHGSSKQGYFWNHAVPPDEAFVKRAGSTLGFESLMCLGCHDGQTALDSFGGASGTVLMTGRAVVGRDLRTDHPVGVAYPASDPRYRDAAEVGAALLLFDGRVECSSCHDPHDNANGKHLRVDRRRLCQTCHDL